MSLLNIVVGEGLAWVAFDTEGLSLDDGKRYPYSKAIPLVHANSLVCGRGERIFLAHIFLELLTTNGITDFDSAAEVLPEILTLAAQRHAQQAEAAGVDVSGIGLEGTLVGWSERRNAPAVLAGTRAAGDSHFTMRESRCIVSPAASVTRLVTEREMTELARRQVEQCRREHPGQPIGGDLILAEITRAGMSFRKISELG